MSNKMGSLTKSNFGYSMPVDAPLYGKGPIYYKDTEAFIISYETDQEAAASMLPEGLSLPKPATAAVMFVKYNFSSIGPYTEVILGIDCFWEKTPKLYIPHIVVDNVIPLAAGREVWGYPKKMAHIEITQEDDLVLGVMERPKNNRIVTIIMRPEIRCEPQEVKLEALSMRVIPSSEDSEKVEIAELVEAKTKVINPDLWTGTGSIQYHSTSVFDPWHKLPVRKINGAQYMKYDYELDLLKVLKRY